jgi:hypothetical protein
MGIENWECAKALEVKHRQGRQGRSAHQLRRARARARATAPIRQSGAVGSAQRRQSWNCTYHRAIAVPEDHVRKMLSSFSAQAHPKYPAPAHSVRIPEPLCRLYKLLSHPLPLIRHIKVQGKTTNAPNNQNMRPGNPVSTCWTDIYLGSEVFKGQPTQSTPKPPSDIAVPPAS